MEFWWGLTAGVFAGANIGIVVAALLAGSKRKEINRDYRHQLQMDQAVMDETPLESPRAHRFQTGASADPAQNF